MNRQRIIWGIVSLVVMIIIFCFSSQPGEDSKQTSGKIEQNISKIIDNAKNIKPEKKKDIKENLTFIVRKTAHFTIYTVLGICLMGFLRTYEGKDRLATLWVIAIFIGMLYAISDEFHQQFVDGRNCELRDVGIDTMGVIVGTCIENSISKVVKRKHTKINNKKETCQNKKIEIK